MFVYRKLKKALAEQEELVAFLITGRVSKDSPTRVEATRKLQALKELENYVESYDWVKTPKTLKKIKVVISNEFNYEESAKELKTTVRTLKVMFSRCDAELKSKIEKPLNYILEGKLEEGVDLFRLGNKELGLQTYRNQIPLLENVLKNEPIEPTEDYSVVEYINALKFIKIYSKPQFALGVEKAGEEQINYILYMLFSSSNKYAYQRELILQYLNKELKLEELILYLSEFEEVQNSSFVSGSDSK